MARFKQQKASLDQVPAWREIMSFYRWLKPGLWAMKLPWIGPLIQKAVIRDDEEAIWFLPIGEAIPTGRRYALPGAVIEHLLREADGVFAIAACPCRIAFECQNHPRDLGCLHLGPVARQIPAQVGRVLTPTEARAHLERALSVGLIPTILHMPSEAEIFGVEKTRLLSVCFCCECCCDVRLLLREGPDRYWDQYNHRLPGVNIHVSQACTRCGECLAACYGGERVIYVGPARAEINDRCIGCGRCIPACPEGAISLRIDPAVDVMDALLERINSRVQIGPELPALSPGDREAVGE